MAKFCTNCGSSISSDAKFCVSCGQRVNNDVCESVPGINDGAKPASLENVSGGVEGDFHGSPEKCGGLSAPGGAVLNGPSSVPADEVNSAGIGLHSSAGCPPPASSNRPVRISNSAAAKSDKSKSPACLWACGLPVFCFLGMCVIFAVWYVIATDSPPDPPKTPKLSKSVHTGRKKPSGDVDSRETVNIAANQRKFNAAGAEVDFGDCNKISATLAAAERHKPDKDAFPGGRRVVYSINVKGCSEFAAPITITLPYEVKNTDPNAEADSVLAEYYDPKAGSWIPVLHRVDTSAKKVIITTTHLSDYGVSTVKDSKVPYVRLSKFISTGLDADKAVSICKEYQESGKPGPQAWSTTRNFYAGLLGFAGAAADSPEAGSYDELKENSDERMQKLNEIDADHYNLINDTAGWLGDLTEITSCDPGLQKLGGAVSNFTMFLAVDSLCGTVMDMYEGKASLEQAGAELTSVLKSYAIGKYASNALKIANIAVVFIDYSLNQFIKEVDKTYKEAVFKAVIYYNEEMNPRSKMDWYDLLYKAYKKTNGNPSRFNALLDHIFRDYAGRFFYDNYENQNIARNGAGYKGLTSGQFYIKKEAQEYCVRQYVVRLGQSEMMQAVLTKLCKRIRADSHQELCRQFNELRQSFDAPLSIEIQENPPSPKEDKYKYAGCKVRLSSAKNYGCPPWEAELDKNGHAEWNGTVLGYIKSGLPAVLEVWAPGADAARDEPVFKQEFSVSQKVTKLAFGDKSEGPVDFYAVLVPELVADQGKTVSLNSYLGKMAGAEREFIDKRKKQLSEELRKYPSALNCEGLTGAKMMRDDIRKAEAELSSYTDAEFVGLSYGTVVHVFTEPSESRVRIRIIKSGKNIIHLSQGSWFPVQGEYNGSRRVFSGTFSEGFSYAAGSNLDIPSEEERKKIVIDLAGGTAVLGGMRYKVYSTDQKYSDKDYRNKVFRKYQVETYKDKIFSPLK